MFKHLTYSLNIIERDSQANNQITYYDDIDHILKDLERKFIAFHTLVNDLNTVRTITYIT